MLQMLAPVIRGGGLRRVMPKQRWTESRTHASLSSSRSIFQSLTSWNFQATGQERRTCTGWCGSVWPEAVGLHESCCLVGTIYFWREWGLADGRVTEVAGKETIGAVRWSLVLLRIHRSIRSSGGATPPTTPIVHTHVTLEGAVTAAEIRSLQSYFVSATNQNANQRQPQSTISLW